MTPYSNYSQDTQRQQAFVWFFTSLVVMVGGLILAARQFPGGFDWVYTVVSALASQKHNPQGSAWFAGAFTLSMLLLWPNVTLIRNSYGSPVTKAQYFAITAIRIGLLSGALMGVERFFIYHLSSWVYKAHEFLALISFLGLYVGIVTLLFVELRRDRRYVLPAMIVASPLVAIGLTQFWLYLDQRDLGWVDTQWRELGISLWLSFAFWQWVAMAFLWTGLGLLTFMRVRANSTPVV